jgi:hypothetical protein
MFLFTRAWKQQQLLGFGELAENGIEGGQTVNWGL